MTNHHMAHRNSQFLSDNFAKENTSGASYVHGHKLALQSWMDFLKFCLVDERRSKCNEAYI